MLATHVLEPNPVSIGIREHVELPSRFEVSFVGPDYVLRVVICCTNSARLFMSYVIQSICVLKRTDVCASTTSWLQ